jgi:hypothetical protein
VRKAFSRRDGRENLKGSFGALSAAVPLLSKGQGGCREAYYALSLPRFMWHNHRHADSDLGPFQKTWYLLTQLLNPRQRAKIKFDDYHG